MTVVTFTIRLIAKAGVIAKAGANFHPGSRS
jgi:hypothetical protein